MVIKVQGSTEHEIPIIARFPAAATAPRPGATPTKTDDVELVAISRKTSTSPTSEKSADRASSSKMVSPFRPIAHRIPIGVTLDITEWRLLEEQRRALLEAERAARSAAEHARRIKDEFLATLSHELRTPLNAILGWSQLLSASPSPSAEEVTEGLQVIERNARAQARLIEDLLDMSQIISGKINLQVQRVSLPEVIRAAEETIRPAANARGVSVRVNIDSTEWDIDGDPSRLQQIFWNLLSNAVKFTPRGGEIRVDMSRVNDHLQIRVADSGQGIPAEFLPYVFDRFRQADASPTRQYEGLGLGLAIVRHLVELHGGRVEAMSDGLGKGATFSVLFP